jgi:hypothetical protein
MKFYLKYLKTSQGKSSKSLMKRVLADEEREEQKMKARVSGVPYPVELDDPRITDQELQEIVLAVMTSGMRQKGARYNLPESMLMEIGKRCFDKGYTAGQKGENDGKTYS